MTPFHACESLSHMDLTDKIALVMRGECNFVQKVWNAQRANASAVIVMDSELRLECVSICSLCSNAAYVSVDGYLTVTLSLSCSTA